METKRLDFDHQFDMMFPMRNNPARLTGPARRHMLIVLLSMLGSVGCFRPPEIRLRGDDKTIAPPKAVVLFLVDGMNQSVFHELLAAGELPNIDKYIVRRGVTVQNAVTGIPSITYAAIASMLTGRYPGHHNIIGNKWFDRRTLIFRGYGETAMHDEGNHDFKSPTIYEMLPDKLTVNVTCPTKRGAKYSLDDRVGIGVSFFMGWYGWEDGLSIRALEMLNPIAEKEGRWPEFMHIYLPALDEVGHRSGCNSEAYRRHIRTIDKEIGKACEAFARIGYLDKTLMILTSDHGHSPIPEDRHIDPTVWLKKRYRWNMHAGGNHHSPPWLRRQLFRNIDAVHINGGNRRYGLYLPGQDGWASKPEHGRCQQILCEGNPPLACLSGILVGATRLGQDQVLIAGRSGQATVSRRIHDNLREYRYDVSVGDPLGYLADPTLAAFVRAGWHDSRSWLKATATSRRPDTVAQIVEAFDSPRSPDILLFALEEWDFEGGHAGGHGSIVASDMRIPMVFAGPDLPAGGRIETARIVDIAPTVVEWLAGADRLATLREIDGISLLTELRKATTAQEKSK